MGQLRVFEGWARVWQDACPPGQQGEGPAVTAGFRGRALSGARVGSSAWQLCALHGPVRLQ